MNQPCSIGKPVLTFHRNGEDFPVPNLHVAEHAGNGDDARG